MKLLCVAGATVALCLLTASAALADTSGLVAAYGFEEPTGTSVTDSAGLNPGTLNGPTRTTSGRFGAGLSFDGVNDRVDVADSNSLDLSTGMTVEAWVQPTALNWRTAVMKERPGGIAYALYASTDTNRPSAEIQAETRAPAAIATNVWTHLASTYDGATLRLYVNGTQVASRAVTGSLTISSGALRIGGNAVWGEYFKGLIDEVRIYNRALTAGEIGADMNRPVVGGNTTPPTAPTLTASVVTGDDVHLSWSAAIDDVAVQTYRIYRDGALISTRGATSPTELEDRDRPVGTYRYTVVAIDAAGNASAASNEGAITIAADTTPPTGSISGCGSTVKDYPMLRLSYEDERGPVTVRLFLDGSLIFGPSTANVTSGSLFYEWETQHVPNGLHSMTMTLVDGAGNETTVPCEWNVHNPVITNPFLSPADGDTVSGTVTLKTEPRADGQPITGPPFTTVEFKVDGSSVGTGRIADTDPSQLAWDTTRVPNGVHTVTAAVYRFDYSTPRATSSIQVRVDNTVARPTGLTASTTGDDVALSWSAVAGAAEYRVFRDGVNIATATGASYTDADRPVGSYVYTVVAANGGGVTSDPSDEATATVEADTTPPTITLRASCDGRVASEYLGPFDGTVTDDRGGPVTVNVDVEDQHLYGPQSVGSAFRFYWDTRQNTNGPVVMKIRARDAAGNETVVDCPWTVKNSVLSVPITGATDGGTVSGTVALGFRPLSDGNPANAPARFYIDGTLVSDGFAYTYAWDTTKLPNGLHTLKAEMGWPGYPQTMASSTIQVRVDNTAPTGLVAAYGFEETGGTTVTDSSGKGNAGTITGGASSAAAGRFGRALSFDGIDDMVTVPDANALDLAPGMTLEAWVKPTTVSDWRTVMLKERPGQLVYALYAAADNSRPQTEIATNASREARGAAALPVGVWSHLAASYDGATLRLYVNGTQAASTAAAGTLVNSAGALRIGGNSIWGERFSGLIDEVRVYERALSAAEIQADRDRAIL